MIKKTAIQSVRGMHDILPGDQPFWQLILKKASAILADYSFDRIETPIMEQTALFIRSVGEATDIVEKEIYSLKTKGGDDLSLRPEGTASVTRAYIEHGMSVWPHPVQLWYLGPFFRHDNPQAGRYRQFHQLGVETFGDENAATDAMLIFIAYKILDSVGIKNPVVKINSIGDSECRPQYIKALKDYYRNRGKKVCVKCKKRLKTNVLRLLDCTEENCKEIGKDVPQIVDYLDDTCRAHFKNVLEFLDEVKIPYLLDPRLVRGLDYYTRTVFEIWPEEKPEEKEGEQKLQLAICSGGRYDKLVHLLGGPKTPASGWAMGIERVVLALKDLGIQPSEYHSQPKVFVAQLGEMSKRKALLLFEDFRKHGITVRASFGRDSIKSQLRIANRLGIKYTIIIGQKEALDDTTILREMDSGVQETIPLAKILDSVKQRLKS
ncbi:MAG: histidine--tRNA ligase [Candidatus Yanofskybacteria bacterium]|nr:histidine--tRNA ligase [Candidatus Yanofskybacteria bacterium]